MAIEKSSTQVNRVEQSNTSNPLNSYSSYNYIFTLAALRKTALSNPSSYRDSTNYFVIARSSGKGSAGLSTDVTGINRVVGQEVVSEIREGGRLLSRTTKDITELDYSGSKLVEGFNKSSPGRFDFFINNVRIETIMGFNEQTNLSVATKLEFDLFEPYSMSGFIEALQVSAVAAGYDQYINTPYLFKMEFIGYPDGEQIAEKATIVPNSTRYFVVNFVGLDIDVTENGAKYKCKCVPFNEKAFGEPAVLKTEIKIKGNTVGDLLKSFESAINDAKQSDTKNERDPAQANKSDTYEIVYPEIGTAGIINGTTNKKIAESKVVELLKSNATYAFADPAVDESGRLNAANDPRSLTKTSPTLAAIMFNNGANIHECISSIVMNSEYVKNTLKNLSNPDSKVVDQYGMVDYFIVMAEMEDKGIYDDKTNKPFYHYRYIVLPYKIHCTRIPLFANQNIDTSKFVQIANRTYNYLYTGSNIDIKSFQLKFNTLFFQAIPRALGNNQDKPATSESMVNPGNSKVQLPSGSKTEVQNSAMGVSVVRADASLSNVHVGNQPNTTQRSQSDPYDALAKNMHKAILENVDQCQAEIEIIGDPYYLVTGGIGNYRPLPNSDGTVGEGEAPYTNGDVMVVIVFKNPVDINETTGEAMFDDRITPYSGVFRVTNVAHTFMDGVFLQKLSLIRVPGQLNIDRKATSKPRAIFESVEDPTQIPTEVPAEPVSTLRAQTNSLAASIASNILPSTGLPGSLSKFASAVGGSLSGVATGLTSVTSLVQSASGGASSALAGLSEVSSAIRLASSGLSALSTNINSAGASITQITDTLKSTGINITDPTKISNTVLAAGFSTVDQLGTSAISAVNGLVDQGAGLLSSVNSKIDLIKGEGAALASQLGVDTSKLAGLSPDLQSKITNQIKDAVASIPSGVDVSNAIKNGLILNNVPVAALSNLPVTQPESKAPPAPISLNDIKEILARGGSLKNIPGVSEVPGIASLLNTVESLKIPSTLNATAIGDKLAVVQSGISQITGQVSSIEASLNKISSIAPAGLSYVADVQQSVAAKFGSVSSSLSSPLDILMKSKA
jgi:hypothetical protein